MARKTKGAPRKVARKKPTRAPRSGEVGVANDLDALPQKFLKAQLQPPATRGKPHLHTAGTLREELLRHDLHPRTDPAKFLEAVNRVVAAAPAPLDDQPEEVKKSIGVLRPRLKSFHGTKLSLAYFPRALLFSPCADKFGYLSSPATRASSKLKFTASHRNLLDELGDLMGNAGRDTGADSNVPAGFTYLGQFVDHDITLDVSSTLEAEVDANTIHNMRTPALDLDSVYGRGPALAPFLYKFPNSGPGSAIKLQLGSNTNIGKGGPGGPVGQSGMQVQTDFDVPRVHNPFNPTASTFTAIIGDPRNDENLIVVQLHHAFLRFHNQVVDMLVAANFTGDVFVEARRVVTHHYQWAVVHDFLARICGKALVEDTIRDLPVAVNSPFRMPVEFAVAAYRFGHSMIRDQYWVNFNFPQATLAQVFEFNRVPRLPVFSNWVVDFNAFFDTGVPVPVHNKARKIDSALANQLEALPGFTGLMAVLAKRNLRRGLALGLPSGQGMAKTFGIKPLTRAELTQDLPKDEVELLERRGAALLRKTPLWYYILREAAVLAGGNQLGPVGARIVAETFVRILKRDPASYLNQTGGFTPTLPSASPTPGDFTFADLLAFAGVNLP